MTPGIDSTESIPCEKSIPLLDYFLEALILREGPEDFRTDAVICYVMGEGHP